MNNQIKRNTSSKVTSLIGNNTVDKIWESFDKHSNRFGKPSEEVDFTQIVEVENNKGMIFFRFKTADGFNILAYKGVEEPKAKLAIICFEDEEILITEEEASNIIKV